MRAAIINMHCAATTPRRQCTPHNNPMRYVPCAASAMPKGAACHPGPFIRQTSFLCPSLVSPQLLWLHRLWVTLVMTGSLYCRTGVGEAAEGAYEALRTVGGADGHVLPIPAAGAFTAGDGCHVQSSCCSWVEGCQQCMHNAKVLLQVAMCYSTLQLVPSLHPGVFKPYAMQLRQLGNTDSS